MKPIIGLLLIIPLGLTACEEQVVVDKTLIRPVRSIVISDGAALQQRIFSGRARASVELDLAFNVRGPLITLPIRVGDKLKKGTVVAQIDPLRFQADLNAAKAALSRAQATEKNEKLSLKRTRELFKKGHVSQARLDEAIASTGESAADILGTKAAVGRAQIELNYTRLKAPFDGVVVERYVDNFEYVQAKQSILRMIDNAKIEMVIDIPENLISLASQVEDVVVVFDAFSNTEIKATISEIGSEATQSTRTYPVTLVMDQPENINILPGMAGRAYSKNGVLIDPSQGNIEVPVTALLTVPGSDETFVWKIDESNSSVNRITVKAGKLTDRGIIIEDGVTKGDRIVTAGVNYLTDGQVITFKAGAAK